jgi:hypothetical protein
MDKRAFYTMACMMVMVGAANAQSYVIVSGTSSPITSPSNLIVDYALSSYDSTLEPGDTGTLTLVIRNTGTLRAENVEVTTPDVPAIKSSKKFFLGTIQAQGTSTASVTYIISNNASVGIHNIPVTIQYDGYNANNKQQNIISKYDFPIKVYGTPKLAIEGVEFGDIDIGAPLEIKFKVKNENAQAFKVVATLGGANQAQTQSTQQPAQAGSQAASASVLAPLLQMAQSNPSLVQGITALADTASKASSSEKAVTILDTDKKYLGDIAEGESVDVSFKAYISDKAVSGAYTLPLRLEYENKGRKTQTEDYNLGVYVSGKPQISFTNVKTDPEEIHQDEKDVEVKVTVENIGTKEVDNFKLTMNPRPPFKNAKSYVQSKDLGMVKTTDSSAVSFYVDVDDKTKPGLYDLDFLVEYKSGTKTVNETKTVRVAVKESPDFRIDSPAVNVTAGEKGRILTHIVNEGKKCDSVTMWVMKKSDQPFDFEDKSQYIGDLDTGESGDAAIQFTADTTAKERNYLVPLEIRCTLDNKVYVSSETTRVNVLPKKESLLSTPMTLVGAGLIMAVVAAYFVYRKIRSMGGDPKAKAHVKAKKADESAE